QHASAEGELGVHDCVAGSGVYGVFFESESADKPLDGGRSVPVGYGRNDRAAGFGHVPNRARDRGRPSCRKFTAPGGGILYSWIATIPLAPKRNFAGLTTRRPA